MISKSRTGKKRKPKQKVVAARVSTAQVAVIGIGCRYPGAHSPRQLWENVLARRREFRRFPDQRLPIADYYDSDPSVPDKIYTARAAYIDGFNFDWADRRIPRSTYLGTDIVQWLALDVADLALTDAGFSRESVPRDRTEVIVGNTLTGEQSRANSMRLRWPFVRRALLAAAEARRIPAGVQRELATVMETIYKSVFPEVTEDTLQGGLSNTIAGRICNFFDLHGGGYTVDGACSSSLLAVRTAASHLASHDADLALAGGVDVSLDTFELIGFAKTGALTPDDMNVYDRRGNGFLPGEGCGFVVLKRLEDARAAGDTVYAVLNGWGVSTDGKGGITAPSRDGQALAIRRAYERVGYSPHRLDFIEGHGTGTTVGDKTELEGIATAMAAFGETKKRICGMTSFKSIVGHTKAAAGVGAFIKAVIAVNRRVLPPTAGCSEPNEVFNTTAQSLYPILQGVVRSPSETVRAGVSAMGFGGINSHVTLESGDAPSSKLAPSIEERSLLVSHQQSEIFVLGASSLDELRTQLTGLARTAEDLSLGDLTDLAADLGVKLTGSSLVRAAIIAGEPAELAERTRTLVQLLRDKPLREGETLVDPRQEIWAGHGVRKTRLGFLLPGQGSQQVGMGRVLAERFEWARDLIARADRIAEREIGDTISPSIFRPLDRAIDKQEHEHWRTVLAATKIAQPAICVVSLLYARFLERLGLSPSVVAGHSLGELTAFRLAGAFDDDSLIRLAVLRGQLMDAAADGSGAMASLAASRDEAQKLIANVDGYVAIANINSPRQTVITGDKHAVQQAVKRATEQGIAAQPLRVSGAFHSKHMEQASAQLKSRAPIPQFLDQMSAVLISSVDGERIESGHDLHAHFSSQIVEQVNFVGLVEQIGKECDVLLEVGPGRVLSGLIEHNTGAAGIVCSPVAPRPESDRELNVALARVFINGTDINWSRLYEGRLVRPFVPASQRVFIDNPCERPFAPVGYAATSATPFSPVVGTLESTLLEASGIGVEEFEDYLRQRGGFLADVVNSDLRSLSPDHRAGLTARRPVHSSDSDSRSFPSPAPVHGPAETSVRRLDSLMTKLVAERTGFPEESISLDSRLLDDLNLDSIKAGELIASAAKEVGAAGRVDPAGLANTTLAEIVNALRTAIGSPESSVVALPAAKATGAAPATALERPDHATGWVRNFAVHYVPQPVPPNERTKQHWAEGHVLILSEHGEAKLVGALSKRLAALGAKTEVAGFKDAVSGRIALESSRTQVIGVLASVASRTGNERERFLRMIQRLRAIVDAASKARSLNVAFVQFGGGRFGTDPEPSDPEVCCATAFARSLSLERSYLRIRVIDLAATIEQDRAADLVVGELSGGAAFAAVGFDADLVRAIPQAHLQQPAEYPRRPFVWSADDVIMVTGGAKGITAECTIALARATGAKFALIGSSLAPSVGTAVNADNEIARTLARFEAEKLVCRYYRCNISDPDAVAELVQRVASELGPVTAVVHGAGLNKPRRIEQVGADEALSEIFPKLLGAKNLCTALASAPPRFFVGISSIIGITGMFGNAWYAFSNEALDLVLRRFEREHPETAVLSIAYSVWGDTGMGHRLGVVQHLAKTGVSAIPTDEGVARFLRLFGCDPGETQVMVTGSLGGLATWGSLSQPLAPAAGLRFIERTLSSQAGVELTVRAKLSLERDRYLKDHDFRGSYLFPTVFGLEAMAQAATHLLDEDPDSIVRIENIRLERPIVVDPKDGAEIELRALASELTDDGVRQVRIGIGTEQSGFAPDHFSATVIFGKRAQGEKAALELEKHPLPLDPREDLYGDLLFQGPLFQRMGSVYLLDGEQVVFKSKRRRALTQDESGFAPSQGGNLVLDDPFFTDVLLQSVQLPLAPDIVLPVGIGRVEIFAAPDADEGRRFVSARVKSREDRDFVCDVVVTDEQKRILERLVDYRVRVLEKHPGKPGAEELATRATHDEKRLRDSLGSVLKELGLDAPAIALAYLPKLHGQPKNDRHLLERPIIHRATRIWLGIGDAEPMGFDVDWLLSGKPRFLGNVPDGFDLSLTHDDAYCLSVIGAGPQGCDMEPVAHRSKGDWAALLGDSRVPLIHEMVKEGEPLDLAATRIWSAVEVARKVINFSDLDLSIQARRDRAIVFNIHSRETVISVVTLPVKLSQQAERVIALVAHPIAEPKGTHIPVSVSEIAAPETSAADNQGHMVFDENLGQQIYEYQFQPAFKECANLSRGVYFTSYLAWIGRVRELFMSDISSDLVPQISTGKWGLVTNWAELRIFGEASAYDQVRARFWLGNVIDSVIPLQCEFQRVLPDRSVERLAYAAQETTWVQVIGHGKVTPAPFPPYFAEFIERTRRKDPKPVELPPLPESLSGLDRGTEIYSAPPSPGLVQPLFSGMYDTTLEDSNLVGNVYYANYFVWQGRVRDLFINSVAPEYLRGIGEDGEMLCLHSRLDYLRDAMPFDRVCVALSAKTVFDCGADLLFQYYRVLPDGREEKLAVGQQEVVWVRRMAAGVTVPAPLPNKIKHALLVHTIFARERVAS